jgi:transposase
MIGQLTEKTPDILGKSELVIITERVDDVALLIGLMKRIGLQEVLDNHIPRHWKQRGLSWGWTAVIWLAYINRYGDHRKVSVRKYLEGVQNTLSHVTEQEITPLDFTDDRLGCLLKNISKSKYWHKIEKELNERTIKVYHLSTDTVRCDATTVSGNHAVSFDKLMQFGHSKDNSNLPQFKLMVGALDPLGMPLASEVVSGEQADDSLYLPVIKRVDDNLNQFCLRDKGDCKMSAFDIRLYIASQENHYLSPLPLTGQTANDMEAWINEGVEKDLDGQLEFIFRHNEKGKKVLIAGGYEFERKHSGLLDGKEIKWTERVLVIKSPVHAEQQIKGLETRIEKAIEKIKVLTPERGRGKRQVTDEKQLNEAIEKVLKEQRVTSLITVEYEKQTEREIRYVGSVRGSKNRQSKTSDRKSTLFDFKCEKG